MLKHYIITHFNLPRENKLDKNGNPTMTLEYLEERFQLFEQFCFPSILNQTNQNFTWLVMFSDKTEEVFRQRIRSYVDRMPNLTPLYLTDTEAYHWLNYITRYILLNTKEEYIITSRLDNDDSYHITYVDRVQGLVKEHNLSRSFIAFPYGQRFSMSHGVAFRTEPYPYNHFISLIVPNDRYFRTVFFCNHTKITESDVPVFVDKENRAMWMEVIHKSNVINNLYDKDLFHPLKRSSLEGFHVQIPRRKYKYRSYIAFKLTRLHFASLMRKGTLGLSKMRRNMRYKKGKRIAYKLYEPKYLDTKEFNLAEDVPNAMGWNWAVQDYKARKAHKQHLGIPFPVSPQNTIRGHENISFDPSDIALFQGSGKYFQADNGGRIYIGKGTCIDNNVGIITSESRILDMEQNPVGEDIVIGKKCWIAFNSVILPGVVLGDYTTVEAGSVVTKSFPKGYCVIGGNPAKIIRVLDRRYYR